MGTPIVNPTPPALPLNHLGQIIDPTFVLPTGTLQSFTLASEANSIYTAIDNAGSNERIEMAVGPAYARPDWKWSTNRNRTAWTYVGANSAGRAALDAACPAGCRISEAHLPLLVRLVANSTVTNAVGFQLGSQNNSLDPLRVESRYLRFTGIFFDYDIARNGLASHRIMEHYADIVIYDRCWFARSTENWDNDADSFAYYGYDTTFLGCGFSSSSRTAAGGASNTFLLYNRAKRLRQVNCRLDTGKEGTWFCGTGPSPGGRMSEDVSLECCAFGDITGKYDFRAGNPNKTAWSYNKPAIGNTTVAGISGNTVTLAAPVANTDATCILSCAEGSGLGARESVREVVSYDGNVTVTITSTGTAMPYVAGVDSIAVYNGRGKRDSNKASFEYKTADRFRVRGCWIGKSYTQECARLTGWVTPNNAGVNAVVRDVLIENCSFENSWQEVQIYAMLADANWAAPSGTTVRGVERLLIRSCLFKDLFLQNPTAGHPVEFVYTQFANTNPDATSHDVGIKHCVWYFATAPLEGIRVLGGDAFFQANKFPGPVEINNNIYQASGPCLRAQDFSGPSATDGQQALSAGWLDWTTKGNGAYGSITDSGGYGDATNAQPPLVVANLAAVKWINPTNYDFALDPTSPMKGIGVSGVDAGILDPVAFKNEILTAITGSPPAAIVGIVVTTNPVKAVGSTVAPAVLIPPMKKYIRIKK